MIRHCLPFAFGSLLLNVVHAAAPTPTTAPGQPPALEVLACPAPEARQFAKVACDMEFYNRTGKAITIRHIEPQRAGDRIEPDHFTIPANGTAKAIATLDIGWTHGDATHHFRIDDGTGEKNMRLTSARAFVTSLFEDAEPEVDLGNVDATLPAKPSTWVLRSHEAGNAKLTDVFESPSFVSTRIDADGRTVQLTPRTDAGWGQFSGLVKLKTDSKEQGQVWLYVRSNVLGQIAANVSPIDFGVIREGNPAETVVELSSRDDKPFSISDINFKDIKGTTLVAGCSGKRPNCQSITLKLPADAPMGLLQGWISVAFAGKNNRLNLSISGLRVGKNTEVRDFNDLLKQNEQKSDSSNPIDTAVATSKPVDLANTLKNAVQAENDPPPPGNGPLVRWSVAHEGGIHGYLIYRADAKDGPYNRINKDTIRSKNPTSDNESRYQWRDTSAVKGNTYWYIIGVVYGDGTKKDLTDAVKAVAK